MNVFVEPTGRRIQPFDDPIGETPVCNRSLAQWQAQAFGEAGAWIAAWRRAPCRARADSPVSAAGEGKCARMRQDLAPGLMPCGRIPAVPDG